MLIVRKIPEVISMRKFLFLIFSLFLILNLNCLDYYSTRIKGLGRGLAMIVDDDLTKLTFNPAYLSSTANQSNLSYTSLNENGYGNIFHIKELNDYKLGIFAEYSYEKDGDIKQNGSELNYEYEKDFQLVEVEKYRHLGNRINFKIILGKDNQAIQYQFLYEEGNDSPRKEFYQKYSQLNYLPSYKRYDQVDKEKIYDWYKTEQTHKISFANCNEPIWIFQNYAFEVWYNHQDVDNKTRKLRKREWYERYKDVKVTDISNQYSSNGIGLGIKFDNHKKLKPWLERHFAVNLWAQMSKSYNYQYSKQELTNKYSYNSSTGYVKDEYFLEEDNYNEMSEREHEGEIYLGYSITPEDNILIALGVSPHFEGTMQVLRTSESSNEKNIDNIIAGVFIPLAMEVKPFNWISLRGGATYRALTDLYYHEETKDGYEFNAGFTLCLKKLSISAALGSDFELEVPIIQAQISCPF